MPKGPTLATTAIISTAVAGVDCTAASGSQAWNGHSGALTANANMKPPNRALSNAGSAPSRPAEAIATISRTSKVPGPLRVVTTYNPTTAASMISPPDRLYTKSFTTAYDGCAPANPPMSE